MTIRLFTELMELLYDKVLKLKQDVSQITSNETLDGAFYFAANKFMANKTDKNLSEAQQWINTLLNTTLPIVEEYCKEHSII